MVHIYICYRALLKGLHSTLDVPATILADHGLQMAFSAESDEEDGGAFQGVDLFRRGGRAGRHGGLHGKSGRDFLIASSVLDERVKAWMFGK